MLTAGTALSLMGLILAVVGKAEAVELSRVTDISPEIYDLSSLTVFDDALYFSAYDRVHGSELFKYDGTTASLVADIVPGIESFSPQYLTVFDNALYFSADDKVNGYELFKYDGTTVSLVGDINPGFWYSLPAQLTVFDNALYFSAEDGFHGRELWKYDGATASLVADINQCSLFNLQLCSINPDGSSHGSDPSGLTVFNNALYFSAYDGSALSGLHGRELWKYDGTTASLAADIFPSISSLYQESSNPKDFTVFNNALYFNANDNSPYGGELWKYDGNTASLVSDIFPNRGRFTFGPSHLTVFDNALYFSASDGVGGPELWKYDGTTVSLVAEINPLRSEQDLGNSTGSFPFGLTVFDNALYFNANDGVHGPELWKYDGTTVSLADINPGSEGSYPYGFTIFNKALYFSAGDRLNGREIWKLEPDEPTSVPEPASALGLLAFSALGTGSMLKRKLQKAAQLGIVDSETSD
jgi:ELWxxDGT repeat protein